MAPPRAKIAPTNHNRRISFGSPRSRAMNPVVVKIPPPMMLLTSTQEAVNHPIFCPEDFCPSSLIGKRLLLSPVDWSRGLSFLPLLPYHIERCLGSDPKSLVPPGLYDDVANLRMCRPDWPRPNSKLQLLRRRSPNCTERSRVTAQRFSRSIGSPTADGG